MTQYGAKIWKGLVVTIFLAFLVGGCRQPAPTGGAVSVITPDFFGIGEELARQLVSNRKGSYGAGERLIFTAMVDLNDLQQTSKFGRTISESLATRLFQHGYGLVEIRKVAGVLVKNREGEIILSRDATRLAKEHEADVIVAGTYSMTPTTVIINVKFLDAMSQNVVSAAGLELQRTHTINYLLSSGSGGMEGERVSAYEL